MSSIQRWSNRQDRLNGLAVVITLKGLVCFRLKCISSTILDFFRQHFGFLYGLVVSINFCTIFFEKVFESGENPDLDTKLFFRYLGNGWGYGRHLEIKICLVLSSIESCIHCLDPTSESGENRKRKKFLSISSANTAATDAVLT